MKQIVIKFVKNARKRIGEPGDWYFDKKGNLQIRINDMGDWRFNLLYAFHELIEAVLCKWAFPQPTRVVDAYCRSRDIGKCDAESFSGYPNSPHQWQHNCALALEWILGTMLRVDWKEYGKACDKI